MPLGASKAGLMGAAGVSGAENYFGDGSDGEFTTSGNVTYARNSTTEDMILLEYTSINIGSGHTVTTDGYSRGIFLYCTGDCTITGTLSMSNPGAYGSGKGSRKDPTADDGSSDDSAVSSTGLRLPMFTASGDQTLAAADFAGCGDAVVAAVSNQEAISGDGTIFQILRTGGAGGDGSATAGTAGATGAAIISAGGGGSGGLGNDTGAGHTIGDGGTGSCFGGGGGTGAVGGSSGCASGDADWNYGTAGCVSGGGYGGHSSGNGNDGGGTIILVVGGDLTITGSVTANAGAGTGGSHSYMAGGGGGGGGVILILYAGSLSNTGTVTASAGGAGSSRAGGAGGAGGVHIAAVS